MVSSTSSSSLSSSSSSLLDSKPWTWRHYDTSKRQELTSWNVMVHAQKPDLVFRRNGRVHWSGRGRHFSRLLAVEVCASAVVMLDTPCSKVVWRVLATHSSRQFPLHFPSRASPCAITFQRESTIPKDVNLQQHRCGNMKSRSSPCFKVLGVGFFISGRQVVTSTAREFNVIISLLWFGTFLHVRISLRRRLAFKGTRLFLICGTGVVGSRRHEVFCEDWWEREKWRERRGSYFCCSLYCTAGDILSAMHYQSYET